VRSAYDVQLSSCQSHRRTHSHLPLEVLEGSYHAVNAAAEPVLARRTIPTKECPMLWIVVKRAGQYRAIPEASPVPRWDEVFPGWDEVFKGTQDQCAKWMKKAKGGEKPEEGGGKTQEREKSEQGGAG
jgi:hypothetical protein